jgi:hypothetical protein
MDNYIHLLKDRFAQRIEFLKGSDMQEKPEVLEELLKTLTIKA